jgi:hypothetical protein
MDDLSDRSGRGSRGLAERRSPGLLGRFHPDERRRAAIRELRRNHSPIDHLVEKHAAFPPRCLGHELAPLDRRRAAVLIFAFCSLSC